MRTFDLILTKASTQNLRNTAKKIFSLVDKRIDKFKALFYPPVRTVDYLS